MAQGNKRKRADRGDEHADGADHTEMEGAPVAPLSECPFTVEYRTGSKKAGQSAAKAKKLKQAKQQQAKRQKGNSVIVGPPPKQELDQTLPEDLNTTVFTIKPKAKWDSLKKYRNFVGRIFFPPYSSFLVRQILCSPAGIVMEGREGTSEGVFLVC